MNRYQGIQVLRYVAAILVVISHATQAFNVYITGLGPDTYWHTGTVGVDIFFVISGFVMVTSADSLVVGFRNSIDFLARRLVRIVPLYWLVLTLKVLIVVVAPMAAVHNSIDPSHIAASFLFIPWKSPRGDIMPFVPVGWTLNLEMLFYCLYALSILARKYRIAIICVMLAALFLLAPHVDNTQLTFWGSSMTGEFCLGMLLGKYRAVLGRMPTLAALSLVAAGAILIFGVFPELHTSRPLEWGLPAACIVAGVIGIERYVDKLPIIDVLVELGASSYSIYLLHTLAIPAIAQLMKRGHLHNAILFLLATSVASTLIGLLSFRWLESKLTRYFSSFLPSRKKA